MTTRGRVRWCSIADSTKHTIAVYRKRNSWSARNMKSRHPDSPLPQNAVALTRGIGDDCWDPHWEGHPDEDLDEDFNEDEEELIQKITTNRIGHHELTPS